MKPGLPEESPASTRWMASAGWGAQESIACALRQDPAQDGCAGAEGAGEGGGEVVRHAAAERSRPQVARAEHRLGPRLPPGQGRLVHLSQQRQWIAILDEGRHLTEANAGSERRIHRSGAGLVDVTQPPACRNSVENQLGAATRQSGLITGVERGKEAGEDLPRDLGG